MFSQSRLLVTITATSHSTPSTRSNIFGVHQDATYCIDGELDPDLVESTYPDIGPPFDIYWIDHRLPTGCDSFPQINNIQEAGKRDTFMLYLLATIVHYPITLQWTHVEIGWSSLVLMDLSPESATEIDMLTDTVITLFGSTSRRLQIIGESTVLDADKYEQNPRSEYILFQNYPNPFNPKTTITYEIPQSAYVSLIVYDQAGSEVRRLFSGYQRSGLHTLEFDAADLASGVYICTVRHGSSERSIKLMVLK